MTSIGQMNDIFKQLEECIKKCDSLSQDIKVIKKGHKQEVDATILAVKNGTSMPISFQEIYAITQATFAAEESMNTGLTIQLHHHK